jgi:hypothetical protein
MTSPPHGIERRKPTCTLLELIPPTALAPRYYTSTRWIAFGRSVSHLMLPGSCFSPSPPYVAPYSSLRCLRLLSYSDIHHR